ncbi:hypothetical protein [Candidatus Lokiarchaeum ossiferum]|uniref:hypothetical protein n=1 Tax=Candidatus Lokiarchaeum ossiferum TaxID=2951803 RepID=UPI00352CBAD9
MAPPCEEDPYENKDFYEFCLILQYNKINYYYPTNEPPHKVLESMKTAEEIYMWLEEELEIPTVETVIDRKLVEIGWTKQLPPFVADSDIKNHLYIKNGNPYFPPANYAWHFTPHVTFDSRIVWIGTGECYHEIGCTHIHRPKEAKWHEAKQKYRKCYYCGRKKVSGWQWYDGVIAAAIILGVLIGLLGMFR